MSASIIRSSCITSSPPLIKTHRNKNRNFESAAYRKSFMRSTVLTILKQREEERKSAKKRQELKDEKVAQAWKEEEKKKCAEKLQQLFDRLSKSKKDCVQQKHFQKESPENPRKLQTASHKHCISYSNIQKAEEKMQEVVEMRRSKLLEKLERAEISLSRAKAYKMQGLQYNNIIRNKKILKSRVAKLLRTETGKVCQHFLKNAERISQADLKESKSKQQAKKTIFSLEKSTTERKLECPEPDEVLLKHFTPEELRQIKEDLDYYIGNKKYREKITLFNLRAMDHRGGFRAATADQKFLNMDVVKKYKKLAEQKPVLPTQTHRYKAWWEKIKEPKFEDNSAHKKERFKLYKTMQAENLQAEKSKYAKSLLILRSKIEDKMNGRSQLLKTDSTYKKSP